MRSILILFLLVFWRTLLSQNTMALIDSLLTYDQLDKAKAEMENYFKNDTLNRDYYYTMGRLAKRNGQRGTAERYYKLCLKTDSTYARGYAAYSALLLTDGDYKMSMEFIGKAIRLDSTDLSFYNSRGTIYFEQAEYELALKDFKKLLGIKTYDPIFLYNYGATLFQLDYYEEALTILSLADAMLPNDANIHYTRGMTYFFLNRDEEALSDLNISLKYRYKVNVYERPSKPNLYYYKGECYKDLNRPIPAWWFGLRYKLTKPKKEE